MKLGIDLGCLSEDWGGYQYYTDHFVRALLAESTGPIVLFHGGSPGDRHGRAGEADRLVPLRPDLRSQVLQEQLVLPANTLRVPDLDRLLVPAYLGPIWAPVPVDLIVHDLLFLRPDSGHSPRQNLYWRGLHGRAFRAADRLFPVSHATRRALGERFPDLKHKLGPVLYPALRTFPPGRPTAPSPNREPYLLFVGTVSPRKNVDGLLEWYRGAPGELRDRYDLRIVGHHGWGRPTPEELESAGPGIHWHGDVSDAELARLYRGAALFCLPSKGEGFGMPVLEAFHHRTPVVLGDREVFREVAGPAARYLDPGDPASWTGVLRPLLEDEGRRRRQITRGVRRLRRFSWARTAARYLESGGTNS